MKPSKVMLLSMRDIAIGLTLYIVILYGSYFILLSNADKLQPNLGGTIIFYGMIAGILLCPIIPIGFIIRSTIRLAQYSDELQQRILLSAIGFAATATGLLTFAYGLLEFNGYPPLDMTNIITFMLILWFVGLLYFRWRYR